MHAPDVPALAAEILVLHADAREAARVAQLCQVAAGQRLLEICACMDQGAFAHWLAGGACPVLPATARAMIAAAEQHAEQERAKAAL